MRKLFPVLVLLVLITSLIPIFATASSSDAWYDTDWSYRQKGSITGTSSGAQTDYQLKLTVYYGEGSSAAGSLYCDEKCQGDFDDLRFTKSDGTTLLDYWVESYTENTSAIVWVEFATTPANGVTAYFFAYYGNAGAASASSGTNTFIWFDDGTGTLADKWSVVDGTWAYSGGFLQHDGGQGWKTMTCVKTDFPLNYRLEYKTKFSNVTWVQAVQVSQRSDNDRSDCWEMCIRPNDTTTTNRINIWKRVASSESTPQAGLNIAYSVDTWYKITSTMDGTTKKIYRDDANTVTCTDAQAHAGTYLWLQSWTQTSKYNYFDDIRVSKFTTTEPAWGTWADEEGPASAPLITTENATDILATTATLNGDITVIGFQDVTVRGFEWDIDSGAPYDNDIHEDGTFGVEAYDLGATGLPDDTTIYFRAYATNSVGTTYGDELTFDTLIDLPLAPTDFVLTKVSSTEVTLTWTTGLLADTTVIRRSTGGFPTSITDGQEIYNGALETCSDLTVDLDSNTYFYSAWGYNDGGYSLDSADTSIGGNGMLFIALIGLGCFFTFFSAWRRYLPSSMAGSITWLALGALWLVSPATIGVTSTSTWTPYIGFVFLLATIVPVMLYIKPMTTMHRETTMKDAFGRTIRSGYEEQKHRPGGKSTSASRQSEYRMQLRDKWGPQSRRR